MNKNVVSKTLLFGFSIVVLLAGCASQGNDVNEIREPAAGGGCCQVNKRQCQDVNRASECRGLGGGTGSYHAGLSCNEKTHQCE